MGPSLARLDGRDTHARALQVALVALAQGLSQQRAAEAAGMSLTTLRRRLQRPDVQAALDAEITKLAGQVRRRGTQRLQAAVGVALDALVTIARGDRDEDGELPDPHARVKASTAILDRAGMHARQGLDVTTHALESMPAEELLAALPEAEAVLRAEAVKVRVATSQDGEGSSDGEEGSPDEEGLLERPSLGGEGASE